MPDSTVYAVASAKGGVGKTTTSINLGTALVAQGLDVVVVELDLAMANVVDFLSLTFDEEADPSMHDVLAGAVPVTAALYDAPGGATVAPSGTSLDALGAVDVTNLADAISTLKERFDVVVLDTGAGVNSATTTALSLADETILVSTPRVASVRDTEKTRTIVEQRGGSVGGLVLTKDGTGSSPGSERLSEFLGVPLLCTVPHDATIHESQDAGVPVVERRPDSEAARAYADGAAALVASRTRSSDPAGASVDDRSADGTTSDGASAATPSTTESPTGDSVTDEPTSRESTTTDRDEESSTPNDAGTGIDPPSKETLEADGWTFPGEADAESPTAAEKPSISVADPTRRTHSLRPLRSAATGDGGSRSVESSADSDDDESSRDVSERDGDADERDGDADERNDDAEESDSDADERDSDADEPNGEGPQSGDSDAAGDDGSGRSLAGRVTALLRRSG